MRSYDVYKITNKINNKVYIGITSKGISARWKDHIYAAERGYPFKLYNAIRKYGKQNFTVELLDFCNSWDELTEKEKQYITQYNSTSDEFGYNMTEGGDGTIGKIVTDTTREKIRQKAIGRIVSEDTRAKISEASKVRTDGREAYWNSGKIGENRRKPILQYTNTGKFIKEFNGVNIAAAELNMSATTIVSALKHRNIIGSKRNPYIWVYKSDYPNIPETVDSKLFCKDPNWKPTISEACRKADLESRKTRKPNKSQIESAKLNGMLKAKSICQYNKQGDLISEFESIVEASRQTKCDRRGIQRQLQNPVDPNNSRAWNNAKYIWKYKTE